MKKLFTLIIMLALLPFMAVGLVFELAWFGIGCGRGACNDMLSFAFKKGGDA